VRAPARRAARVALPFVALALGACSVIGRLDAPATQGPMAPAPVATPGTSAPAPAARRTAPAAPVDPAVQQAFDQARRAMAAGHADQAERLFRTLAQAHPDLAGPHANLGVLARQAGHLDQSVSELEQAAQLNPGEPSIYNELGISYRAHGQFQKAQAAYGQALALDPQNAPAVLNLGILYDLYLGDDAKALAQYQRYLALSPGGDATVTKWVAEIEHRRPAKAGAANAGTTATATAAAAATPPAKGKP
jgi:Flp pilus assembly protein TadD